MIIHRPDLGLDENETDEQNLKFSSWARHKYAHTLYGAGSLMRPDFDSPWGSRSDRGLIVVLVVALSAILTYVRSLIYFVTSPVVLNASQFIALLALTVILVRSKLQYRTQVFLVLLSSFVLMIATPLRLPPGIMTIGPDMIYQLQIMQSMTTTGSITFNAPTAYALGYIFTPMQETLLVMTSMVLGASAETVLKYAGPVFGVLTLAFLLGFYQAYFSKRDALIAAFLAGNCFELLQASTIHFTLAFVFFSLAMYGLTKTGLMWRLIVVLSAVAIVSTHEFTAIVTSVFLAFVALCIIILARWFEFKRGAIENAVFRMPALMVTLTFAWLAFVAFPFFGSTVGILGFVLAALLSGTTRVVLPIASNLPNSWEQVVGDISAAVFAVTCVGGFLLILVKKERTKYQQFLPYAISSALIFFIGFISYLRFHQGTDLLLRGFLYVYFFSAPVAFYAILKLSSAFQRPTHLRHTIAISLIFIIVLGGLYTLYPRHTIDSTAPLNNEDVRFPLYQWQSAGYFASAHLTANRIWGDKIAFDYVGGYGDRDMHVLDNTLNITLAEWMSSIPSKGDIVVLRHNMPVVPFANYRVSSRSFHEILATHNIIYSSGEVVMVDV